ncbi:MAG: glycosyltransferase family 2 protein [Tannerella sp.]|jgi:GT2 family glycosyltransferase|nr:glycosyltransferase family 2 protein [Tannerella sp.]
MNRTESAKKSVSVIILNWNGKALMAQFLPSVIRHTPPDRADIVVADNGSTDGSVEMLRAKFPTVRIIAFSRNHGFAEGYNRAIAEVETDYVVLLNSDVEVTPHWLDQPVGMLDADGTLAGVQPKIRSYNAPRHFEYAGAAGGWIDRYGYPFCRGRVLSVVEEDRGQYDTPADVFWTSGACTVMRRTAYLEAGGLDAYFFAHQEEIDLCWRLGARGFRFRYAPGSTVYHVGGATLRAESPHKTFLNFRNNLLMIYKNMPDRSLAAVMRRRFWLDSLAMLRFLLAGQFANARAVLRARKEYRRKKPAYRAVRRENLARTVVDPLPATLPKSMLLAFYLKRKDTFAKLLS